MRIAIVTGGFDGVIRQKRIWDLERDVQKAEQALLDRVELSARARADLLCLQNKLATAGPSREVKGDGAG